MAKIDADANAIPVYEDEAHFQIQTTVTRAWFKRGSAPTVKSLPGRQKVAYAGFVVPWTGELHTTKPGRFTYETTIDSIRSFLSARPAKKGKRYAIFMDNAPWHKKAYRLVQEERRRKYADIRRAATLELLPPYSPDLNPIEQVWRITRRENTHNVFFPSIEKLEETVDAAFKTWRRPNEQLKSLCQFNK